MKISSIAIGFLSAAWLCGQASAAETDYAAGAQALALQQAGGTARAMAMGSAVVAVPDGSASLLWNPAGLSRMSCKEVGLHDDQGLAGTLQEIAIFGMPLGAAKECNDRDCQGGSLGGIAASFDYVNYGSINGADTLGNQTGNYSAAEYAGSVGWGLEVLPSLSAGVGLKTNWSNIGDQGYQTYAADLGLLWNIIPAVDLGLTYDNINLGRKVGGNLLTEGWRVGAGWTVNPHWLLAAAGELQNNGMTNGMNRIQLGTEYLIGNLQEKNNILALRAGYDLNYPNPQLSGLTGLTLGLGYTITRALVLDYAMTTYGDLGISNRVSLTFKFACQRKSQVIAKSYPAAPAAAAPAPIPAPAPAPAPAPMPAAELIVAAQPIVLKSILLEDSHFDFDKSTLKPEGMAALRENVQLLKDNPNTLVRVAGYTSMMGTAEYNQRLSERRAAAVENFLVTEGGIAPGRITTIGFGATEPATYEVSPGIANSAAAKSNMRVLFEITVKP
jgi:outer membrane protein OmpA-like peptidoglycan-associated protein